MRFSIIFGLRQEPASSFPAGQELYHGLAHGQADVHVGLGVTAIVAIGGAAHGNRMGIDDGGVTLVGLAEGKHAVDDHFLAVSDDGIASCFEASTGQRFWRQRIGKGHSAALVAAGGLVYFLSDTGVMRVVQPGAQFKLIAENAIGERCYASPAISQGQIFIKGDHHLFCIGK